MSSLLVWLLPVVAEAFIAHGLANLLHALTYGDPVALLAAAFVMALRRFA